jgi:bifunctional oligoribonuclease and PAP phosphatase NrnA
MSINNRGEADYGDKVARIAAELRAWQGPIVLISHIDPDGDALGSTLALKRALDTLGKTTMLPMDVPRFLTFLVEPDDISPPLEHLPENCLLAILDVADEPRAVGAPTAGAAFTVNIDHHGTNARFGDLSLVEPAKAATAQIIKDVIDALGVPWTPDIALPCLAGIITDTGNFRYGNTDHAVLSTAGELIDTGIDYAALTDRLQLRHPSYFQMLAKVMDTVEFPLGGLVALAYMTQQMEAEVAAADEDSNDYVGLIRYAEGSKVAIFLKERGGDTKISVRTRDGVSAQRICVALGGGGHVAAAGAKVAAPLEETRRRVLEATREELARHGLLPRDAEPVGEAAS